MTQPHDGIWLDSSEPAYPYAIVDTGFVLFRNMGKELHHWRCIIEDRGFDLDLVDDGEESLISPASLRLPQEFLE